MLNSLLCPLIKQRKKAPNREGCKDKTGKKSYKLSASKNAVHCFWQAGQCWILTFSLLDIYMYISLSFYVYIYFFFPASWQFLVTVIQWETRNAVSHLLQYALKFQQILEYLRLTFILSLLQNQIFLKIFVVHS